MYRLCLFLSIVIVCFSCGEKNAQQSFQWQEIHGRDWMPLYRIHVPISWKRKDPPLNTPLKDTKIALCEFFIDTPHGLIRITIHNFPSESIDQRIPPGAQIARWKRQLGNTDDALTSITPQSFSGFVGMLFEASGNFEGAPTSVMAWSLQLAPEHYRMLSRPGFPFESRADVTIKASGPPESIAALRNEILAFARSFELIDEIPTE